MTLSGLLVAYDVPMSVSGYRPTVASLPWILIFFFFFFFFFAQDVALKPAP